MRHPNPLVGITLALGLSSVPSSAAQDPDDKFAKRVATFDKKLVKTLEDLAVQYDKDGDVETASFFAECATGFGSKDEKIKAIKLDCELKVYFGKVQGGKPLGSNGPIRVKLDPSKNEYKKIVEECVDQVRRKKQPLSDSQRKILFDVMVKYEISAQADEYLKATKRVNELRKGMKLRSVLWDFENSRKLILGAAPAAAAGGEYFEATQEVRKSIFFDETLFDFMVKNSARGVAELEKWVEETRACALVRMELLNPNARRLWLGHWDTFTFTTVTCYRIPLLPFRQDIPTPTQRFEGETVAKDWVDTEEVFDLNGRKVPFSRYPFDGETDLPCRYAYREDGWKDGYHRGSGLPVMLRFFGKTQLGNVDARLIVANGGKEIAAQVFVPGDERLPGLPTSGERPTILLVPDKELNPGLTYTAIMKCTLDGVVFEKSWSFTAGKK